MRFLDRLRQQRPPTAELDRITLAQLRSAGAQLALPRHVLHFLDFAHESGARRAADAVESMGYRATVTGPSDDSTTWSVRAEATRVVDQMTVSSFRAQFEQIAAEHDGEYDGWEAAAEP